MKKIQFIFLNLFPFFLFSCFWHMLPLLGNHLLDTLVVLVECLLIIIVLFLLFFLMFFLVFLLLIYCRYILFLCILGYAPLYIFLHIRGLLHSLLLQQCHCNFLIFLHMLFLQVLVSLDFLFLYNLLYHVLCY